jgi:hypothetical protein
VGVPTAAQLQRTRFVAAAARLAPMSDKSAACETINEARACLMHAVRMDAGRRAMEGDVESAYERLEEARDALERDDYPWARRAVDEALELLRTEESRRIVEDVSALADAIRLLGRLRFE